MTDDSTRLKTRQTPSQTPTFDSLMDRLRARQDQRRAAQSADVGDAVRGMAQSVAEVVSASGLDPSLAAHVLVTCGVDVLVLAGFDRRDVLDAVSELARRRLEVLDPSVGTGQTDQP